MQHSQISLNFRKYLNLGEKYYIFLKFYLCGKEKGKQWDSEETFQYA